MLLVAVHSSPKKPHYNVYKICPISLINRELLKFVVQFLKNNFKSVMYKVDPIYSCDSKQVFKIGSIIFPHFGQCFWN